MTYYLTPYRPIRLTTCRALLTEMGFFWVKKKVTTETIANSHTCMGFPIELINLTLTVNVKDDSFADSRRNVVGSDAEVSAHLSPFNPPEVQGIPVVDVNWKIKAIINKSIHYNCYLSNIW